MTLERIAELKKSRQAIILAHNYQPPEIQDVADFVGDSFELSQKAAGTDARVIIFCGVRFMAETASILSPDKKVIIPDNEARCPMADMITAQELRKKKRELPTAAVVCYVNSSAKVKAESDICCTSANAAKVVESLEARGIIFVPDQYLGQYVSTQVKKDLHLWEGFCPVHSSISVDDIAQKRAEYPGAKVVVHPECRPDVISLADQVLSTGGMCRYAKGQDFDRLIVGTEVGILHRLRKENPDKEFIPASPKAICPDMKKITLEKVLFSLETLSPEVKVPLKTRLKARRALERMLEI